MKIRTTFVSNSSSSSFICDVCDRAAGGWDLSAYDVDMYECTNGHTVCCEHVCAPTPKEYLESLTTKELKSLILSEYYTNSITDRLRALTKPTKSQLLSLFTEHYAIESCGIPSVLCPVCRLEIIPDRYILQYILEDHLKVTRADIGNLIRTSYQNYKDFVARVGKEG